MIDFLSVLHSLYQNTAFSKNTSKTNIRSVELGRAEEGCVFLRCHFRGFKIKRFNSFYIDRKSNLYSADKVSRQSVIADNQGRDYSPNKMPSTMDARGNFK